MKAIAISLLIAMLIPGSSAAESAKPKVGISLPLTGVVARMGESMRRGFALYQKEHPEELGRVEVVFDDHAYDGKQVLSSYQHLTKVIKTDLIVMWGNTPAETVAPLAERDHVPALLMAHEPVAKDRRYVVAMGNRFEKAIDLVAGFFQQNKMSHPAAIYVNLGNALRAVTSLKDKLGGNLLDLPVNSDLTSFQPLILRMRQARVDGLLLFTLSDQALTFGQQAKTMQFSPPIIGGDVFADETFLAQAKNLLGTIKFVYGGVEDWFIRRYREEYHDISYFFEAASGYTLAAIIYKRVPSPGTTWKELLESRSFEGLPLKGLMLGSTPEDGLRLENASAIYSSDDLI